MSRVPYSSLAIVVTVLMGERCAIVAERRRTALLVIHRVGARGVTVVLVSPELRMITWQGFEQDSLWRF